MKERILEFLKSENKSSAQLADEIGVQASGISHILSGRNNPSLDFVLKMLEKYPFLSTEWLLFGKGSMYKDSKMQTLFEDNSVVTLEDDAKRVKNDPFKPETDPPDIRKDGIARVQEVLKRNGTSTVIKIVWFYDNNSFEEYFPRP